MKLATDDLRAVFARADEIQNSAPPDRADIEAVIQAAAEVGIARSAVERALRERLNLPMRPLAVGDLTFAKSADDKFFVAEVVSLSGDNVRVRFLRGGEHTVAHDELRPCSFLPGERVICPWPQWGPWTCTVLSYDAAEHRIEATDGWGEKRSFSIRDVWITPLKNKSKSKAGLYGALIAVGATVGAAIGSVLTLLILR
jgi:hypothetical protein